MLFIILIAFVLIFLLGGGYAAWKKSPKQAYEDKIYEGICPQCGGKLVERNGRYGTFYGCSNYPNCKFTRED